MERLKNRESKRAPPQTKQLKHPHTEAQPPETASVRTVASAKQDVTMLVMERF